MKAIGGKEMRQEMAQEKNIRSQKSQGFTAARLRPQPLTVRSIVGAGGVIVKAMVLQL
jgi:hypothetical protein